MQFNGIYLSPVIFLVLLAVLVIECSNNSLFFTSIIQLDMLLLYPNTAV